MMPPLMPAGGSWPPVQPSQPPGPNPCPPRPKPSGPQPPGPQPSGPQPPGPQPPGPQPPAPQPGLNGRQPSTQMLPETTGENALYGRMHTPQPHLWQHPQQQP